jgi:hypothetical protein
MLSLNGYIETPKKMLYKTKKVVIWMITFKQDFSFKKTIGHHRKSASLGGIYFFSKIG